MTTYKRWTPTKAQQRALLRLVARDEGKTWKNYRAARRDLSPAFGDCAMIKWCGMTLGIETDGYTHS